MKTCTRLAAVAAGVLALSAHPAAQNREHQQQTAELRIMQQQQQELSIAISQLAEAVKALNTRLDEASATTRKGFADQELSIRNMSGDLSAIRERTQETDTRIRSLRDEIDALRGTISNLPSIISQAAPVLGPDGGDAAAAGQPGGVPGPVSAAPPAPAGPPPSTAGLSPDRMLQSAKSDYFAGQFALAISGFEALVRAFPRSEAAGEAQFYTGESYYAQNKWREAIDAYGLVIQNFRTAPTVPDAYRKRGQAYAQTGQLDKAREAWETVIKAYPESDAARLASQDLQRINRTTPPPK